MFASIADESDDDFERVFFKSLVLNVPKFYTEAFSSFRKKVLSEWDLPEILITNNDHYSNDIAKLTMVETTRSGGRLIWDRMVPIPIRVII